MKHHDDPAGSRLEAFVEDIAGALTNDAQRRSFAAYAVGLLSDGERKSMEPIAARVCPDVDRVDAMHQRLQHFLSNAAWSDRDVRRRGTAHALTEMLRDDRVRAWIIDDTGMLKQGKHSVGVQRQYTGSAGKIANCQIAVSLSISTSSAHVPVDVQLYLPESWTRSRARRRAAKIPAELPFRTKTEIAIEMIEDAVHDNIPRGVLLADAFYGRASEFRDRARELGFEFIVAIDADTFLWPVEDGIVLRKKRQRADEYADTLPHRSVTWRDGTKKRLSANFGFGFARTENDGETYIFVCEQRANEKPKFYLAALDEERSENEIVRLLKERWRTERVYEDLKGELGFDHFEGRTYPGWNHHVSVVLCCFAFLAAERARAFSPSAPWSKTSDAFASAARAALSRLDDHAALGIRANDRPPLRAVSDVPRGEPSRPNAAPFSAETSIS